MKKIETEQQLIEALNKVWAEGKTIRYIKIPFMKKYIMFSPWFSIINGFKLRKEKTMPFKSEKQRRYLWKNEPEIAKKWTKKYGSKIQKKNKKKKK